jgi:hypothetical protein
LQLTWYLVATRALVLVVLNVQNMLPEWQYMITENERITDLKAIQPTSNRIGDKSWDRTVDIWAEVWIKFQRSCDIDLMCSCQKPWF